MVTVTEYQICEVTLMPLFEETSIVASSLLTSPHVKTFIHHDDAHRIAHIQQLRSWRVMRGTDAVDTHRLQLRELTVHSVLVDCSTQAAEIVMFTDSVQLKILAIEPEACLCIKLKITEARRRPYLIDNLSTNQHLRANLIYIRILYRP